jgi:hypothetical protein
MLAEPPLDTAPAPSSAPDWSTLSKDVLCPLCDYNLRGLSDTRCPECGYTFIWEEVLNPEILRHPYLFEHNPRKSIRSFFATLFNGMRPRRFWSSLRATHAPRRGRLLLYAFLCASLLLFVVIVTFVRTAYETKLFLAQQRTSHTQWLAQEPEQQARLIKAWGSINAYLDSLYPRVMTYRFLQLAWYQTLKGGRWSGSQAVFAAVPSCIALILWPWLTFLTLMIFVRSMRRASVRPFHVARCAIYSSDAIWLIPVVIGFMPAKLPLVYHYSYAIGYGNALMIVMAVIFAALTTWRLSSAYRCYLKFPHAAAVAVASQLIIVLTVVVCALNMGYHY